MYTLFPVRFAWYLFAAAVAGLLLYLIALSAPVLTPFLLSAVLAYICLPPIGILSALLVFVPYLGALVGLLLGTLAGFNPCDGVLLALPASAALLVASRHLRAHCIDSDLYKS